MEQKGIDVSSWNEKPDWKQVAAAGIDFGILRVHQKTGIDRTFEYNYEGCRNNNIAVGVYKYSYALNVEQARQEAEAVLQILGGRPLTFPVFYDLEWEKQRDLPKDTITKIAETFLTLVARAGYQTGIYCNLDWYEHVLDIKALSYDYWIAAYPMEDVGRLEERLRPKAGVGWQYSSKGVIQGVSGFVDLNVFYKDYKEGEPLVETAGEIDKIYAAAKEELGYLEKATNAYLDSKTKNAGYNNYTKYWRDTRNRGRMACYGYTQSGTFAGGPDWPYCADGLDDVFCRALGKTRGGKLLLHETCAYINCETLYQRAKAKGRIFFSPQPGDIVLFFNNSGIHYHTEWCYRVEKGIFYTIGWNTSGASTVIANGGGVCAKRYQAASARAHYYRPAYKTLQNQIPDETGISVTVLKYGTLGTAVKTMQTMLIYLGYSCGEAGADGSFGQDTLKAVVRFQKDIGFAGDGIYGENTSRELNIAYQAKGNQGVKEPSKARRLFVGKIKYSGVDVRTWAGREYGNIKSWPKLNQGNLVDVLDYDQKARDGELWRYVRIADQFYGFVQDKNIQKV